MRRGFKKKESARLQDDVSLAEALMHMFKRANLTAKLEEAQLLDFVRECLGAAVTERLSKVYLSQGQLWIHSSSAPLRNELFVTRNLLMQRLNEKFGREVVKEVVIGG